MDTLSSHWLPKKSIVPPSMLRVKAETLFYNWLFKMSISPPRVPDMKASSAYCTCNMETLSYLWLS